MSSGCYKLGFCRACRQNVQHFRGRKTARARLLDATSLFILNYGPWYCAQCESCSQYLPWTRKNEPTLQRIDTAPEQIGNFIRSGGSLVLRKKRSGRYSVKFREGVVSRLLSGKTSIAGLTTELKISEGDLLSWINEVFESKNNRISELTSLLKAYHRAAADLIGISDESANFDTEEKIIDGTFRHSPADFTDSLDNPASHAD